ncbi:MAG: glycoside hydrolase family 2 TIM barrel-domain containing protein [Bacteroidota bacterium]
MSKKRIPLLLSRSLSFLPISLFSVLPLFGQGVSFLQNGQSTPVGTDIGVYLDTPTRYKIDLAGTWSYTTDEETWGEVKVPSVFDYSGRTVFLRRFTVADSLLTNCSFSLVALGINYEAEMFVNDIFIGKHTGGSTSFQVDIPEDVLQKGEENAIKIIVSNVLSSRTTLPLRKQIWGWRTYGGIYRDIFILATPRLWLQSLHAKPVLEADLRSGSLGVQATVSNRNFPSIANRDTSDRKKPVVRHQFILQLVDPERQAVVTQAAPYDLSLEDGRDTDVSVSFPVAFPRPWTPESPTLYQLRALIVELDGKRQATVDVSRIDVGFSRVSTRGADLLINGKKTSVRGVVWYEDSPEFGAAMSYDRMEKDVALIKALGANSIRFAFHPPHPYMVDLCNRYGLLAFIELPVWNAPAEVLNDEVFTALAETIAREMVLRDKSHPSIAGWGIGSEFDSGDPRSRGFVERIAGLIRSLDDRPVYYGSNVQSDAAADLVDFTAVHFTGGDLREFKESLAAWKKQSPDKPVLLMQYGTEVQSGNHNGYSDPISEEAQARFFVQYYAAIRESEIAGSFIRSFADWRGDRPILTVEQSDLTLHPVGLLSYDREKRLSYDVVKTTFAGQRVAAFPIGKHRTAFPVVHVVAGFIVIFAIAYQYHYNRRFNESFKRSLLRSYNFFADLRDVRTVSIFHTLLMSIMISLTLGVVLSSVLYHFRKDVFADYVITQFIVWDAVKEHIIRATWNPLEGILGLTGFFLAMSVLLSLVVRIWSLFIRSKLYWLHVYTVIVWAAVPLVFLSPLGMSLFKILQTPFYVIPAFAVLAFFLLWTIARTLKGISVIFDMNAARTYIGGVLLIAASFAVIIFYYDTEFQLTAYLEFLLNKATGSG